LRHATREDEYFDRWWVWLHSSQAYGSKMHALASTLTDELKWQSAALDDDRENCANE
jgi:hypothetical protein